jgi:hypothetical protein
MGRSFVDVEAKRSKVPLLIGLFGPSGGGKTFSGLRLATGIQRVNPGDIYLIDTENGRGRHYADRFRYRYVKLDPPFTSLDYLAAIEHCDRKGASVIVIDSQSHEHEGEGGMLDYHEREVERLCKGDERKRESVKMLAWAKPKADRQRLLSGMLRTSASLVLCFRAKEKIRLLSKAERAAAKERGEWSDGVERLGFMPIGDLAFVYEMTLSCLLLPGARGVPTWSSDETGERAVIKVPEQFRGLARDGTVLDEAMGETMARWAAGTEAQPAPPVDLDALIDRYGACLDDVTLRALNEERQRVWASLDKTGKTRAKAAADSAAERVAKAGISPTSTDDAPEPGSEG